MIGYKDKRIKGWEKHRQREGYGAMWGQQEVEEKRQGKDMFKEKPSTRQWCRKWLPTSIKPTKEAETEKNGTCSWKWLILALCKPE